MAQTKLPAPGVGELTALLPSWRLHLEASNLSPRTIRAYTDDGALLAAFLAAKGMPTAVLSIRREHVEAFIVAELERTSPASAATRYRSLQQLFNWLDDEGEIDASPMAKMRPPKIPEKPVPVLSDDHVRLLLAACSGKDFRNRRDCAIIRLFLDTGMRLEGMSCPVSSPGSGSSWLILVEECLEAAVGGGVVGEVVLPAAPDDVGPGSGEDAHGVGVVAAACDGLVVEGSGPGAGPAGVAGEVAQGVAELLAGSPAERDGLDLARLPGGGRDSGQAGQGVAGGEASACVADPGEQAGGADNAGAGQGCEDRGVGVGGELLADAGGQDLNLGVQRAQDGYQGERGSRVDAGRTGRSRRGVRPSGGRAGRRGRFRRCRRPKPARRPAAGARASPLALA